MKVLIIGKMPPLQGGVSVRTFSFVRNLRRLGYTPVVVTNASSSGATYRHAFDYSDDMYFKGAIGEDTSHELIVRSRRTHIPFSKSYETRLIGVGAQYGKACDLVIGWYYQPYGIAAATLARELKKPCVLMHAGSDITRLANLPEYIDAYRVVFKNVDFLASSPKVANMIQETISPAAPIISIRRAPLTIPPYFRATQKKLSIVELRTLTAAHMQNWEISENCKLELTTNNQKESKNGVATIGVYGKAGEQKGHHDLLSALREVGKQRDFNLVFCTGGHPGNVGSLVRKVLADAILKDRTWIFPFIAPWRIPTFIRMCNAICFLERNFEVDIHSPQVPREVMWAGRALVCSDEIAAKQSFGSQLVDKVNFFRAGDPKDVSHLISILKPVCSDLDLVERVGYAGKQLLTSLQNEATDPIISALERSGHLVRPDRKSARR